MNRRGKEEALTHPARRRNVEPVGLKSGDSRHD